ncbi:MAG: hypothetical protein OXC38_01370 [Gammaproteobacteria bacterium]|nr:hypothetical protein [Gammaproteobacteria bacterium]
MEPVGSVGLNRDAPGLGGGVLADSNVQHSVLAMRLDSVRINVGGQLETAPKCAVHALGTTIAFPFAFTGFSQAFALDLQDVAIQADFHVFRLDAGQVGRYQIVFAEVLKIDRRNPAGLALALDIACKTG